MLRSRSGFFFLEVWVSEVSWKHHACADSFLFHFLLLDWSAAANWQHVQRLLVPFPPFCLAMPVPGDLLWLESCLCKSLKSSVCVCMCARMCLSLPNGNVSSVRFNFFFFFQLHNFWSCFDEELCWVCFADLTWHLLVISHGAFGCIWCKWITITFWLLFNAAFQTPTTGCVGLIWSREAPLTMQHNLTVEIRTHGERRWLNMKNGNLFCTRRIHHMKRTRGRISNPKSKFEKHYMVLVPVMVT